MADNPRCVMLTGKVEMTQERPRLGLATTRELLKEIHARGEVSATIGEYPDEMGAMAMGAANLLETLPGSMLDYKTVSGGNNGGVPGPIETPPRQWVRPIDESKNTW